MTKKYKLFSSKEAFLQAIPIGGRKMVRIGDKRVCIFQQADGPKVFDNLCPHNLHSLFEGNVNHMGEVVCPLHGYQFSLRDGKESQERCSSLNLHKIEHSDEGVFLVMAY